MKPPAGSGYYAGGTPFGVIFSSVDTVKPFQCVRAESSADRHVDGVASPSDQDPTDPWRVVAWIEDVPGATEKGLDPAEKSIGSWTAARRYRRGSRCSSGPDVHAPAERDGQMGKVAAHAASSR